MANRRGRTEDAEAYIDKRKKYNWKKHHEAVAQSRARCKDNEPTQPDGSAERWKLHDRGVASSTEPQPKGDPWAQFRVQSARALDTPANPDASKGGTADERLANRSSSSGRWEGITLQ